VLKHIYTYQNSTILDYVGFTMHSTSHYDLHQYKQALSFEPGSHVT